ncbi:helix-turn-helix transcriptional regulator [Dongia deserti]|uniref:helix-turn-helix transcriptional regulator n=1 Tax=Dongia deserti TaxID=2268030 RepID=UPI0013C4B8BA|nr:AlpA family phage regulatory protein [Dongia deserti]
MGDNSGDLDKRTASDGLQHVLPALPHLALRPVLRTIRRAQLREMVPLADTTIYELEQRGEFPRRFNLTPRCVVWDLAEVEAWIEERRRASQGGKIKTAPKPDVRRRRMRPVR